MSIVNKLLIMNITKMNFRAMMLCLLVVLFAGSMVSCSGDDDNSGDETPGDDTSVPVAGAMSCDFVPTDDELALFDVTAEYTDASGKVQTEVITGEWKKTVTFTSLPANATLTIRQSLKSDVKLTKESYKLGGKMTYGFSALNSAGKAVSFKGTLLPETVHNLSIGKDRVEEFATKNPVLADYAYTISNKANSEGYFIW